MIHFLTRDICERLEEGLLSWANAPLAVLEARGILGWQQDKYQSLYVQVPKNKTEDNAQMLAMWMALTVLEDEERTKRINDALDTLRELCA